ncbi:hypothetical protein WJX73_001440 [Symbiochloris irregularis]|uniref:Uncharacterized protein n=1 Tax=Symbiochloris irregularis TaxID=706552 RepID=A0AAW1PV67_9CHLO
MAAASPPAMPDPSMDAMTHTHECDGTPMTLHGGGTWHGHVYPGIIFLGWGLWWTYHTFRLQLRSRQLGDAPFQSQPWYAASLRCLWAIEPVLKTFGAPFGILVELRLDHTSFLNLICREDGTFAMRHIHNWQHASSYPGFIVSGAVDFLGMWVPLPPGTQQVFLALSFGLEGFLMLMHKKHEALDEGAWLCSMGQMLFTESVAWQPGPGRPGAGAAMMAPAAFAMVVLALGVCMLLLYVCMHIVFERVGGYHRLPTTMQEHDPHEPHFKGLELSREFSGDDSANEQSEGSEGHTTPPQKLHGSSSSGSSSQQQASGRRQLTVALSSLRSGGDARGGPRHKPNDHII